MEAGNFVYYYRYSSPTIFDTIPAVIIKVCKIKVKIRFSFEDENEFAYVNKSNLELQ